MSGEMRRGQGAVGQRLYAGAQVEIVPQSLTAVQHISTSSDGTKRCKSRVKLQGRTWASKV
jgi:hypothetical protein